jgi:hypothetical protein
LTIVQGSNARYREAKNMRQDRTLSNASESGFGIVGGSASARLRCEDDETPG